MAVETNRNILQALALIDESKTSDDVVLALTNFVGRYGFKTVLIAQLVNPANLSETERLMISDWPAELFEARRALNNPAIHDPIGRFALRTKRPFSWNEAYRHANKFGRLLIDQARDFDMREGMMFPVHAYDSVPGGVSLGAEKLDLSRRDVSALDLVAQHAYFRLEQLLGPFPYQIKAKLTEREVEVVHYAAAGKSNRQIAEILGISPFTVRDYLKEAAYKLHTANRAHTVAVAIAQSHISA